MSLEQSVLNSVERLKPNLIRLLRELIREKSVNPPGNVTGVAKVLESELTPIGMDVSLHSAAPGMVNLQATLEGTNAKPRFLFNGHMDVVSEGDVSSWSVNPFEGTVKDDLILGRGTADMKGGLAAVATCLRALTESGITLNGEVVFHAVADEEVDSINGTKYMISHGLASADMGIVAEGSVFDGRIAIRHAVRGNCWLKLKTYGKAAHASNPTNGINAVLSMSRLLLALESTRFDCKPHKYLPAPTISPGTVIKGGTKTNVIPEQCEAEVDARLVPGMNQESVLSKVNDIINAMKKDDSQFSASVEVLAYSPPAEISEASPVLAAVKRATRDVVGYEPQLVASYGTTDGTYLVNAGIPVICGFGPGDHKTSNEHGPDENVRVSELVHFAQIYALTLMHSLGYEKKR